MILTAMSQSILSNEYKSYQSPRVPKLKVRYQTDADAITPVHTSPPTRAGPGGSSNTSDGRPSQDRVLNSAHGTGTSSSHATVWHDGSPKSPAKEEKRRRGVLGFFTLKEPSASAWEDFARQQRAEASAKGSKAPPAAKKLPDTVPKVNSKWDGLPNVARERPSTSSSVKKSTDLSTPASKRSAETHHWDSPSSSQGHERDRSLRSRGAHTPNLSGNTSSSGGRCLQSDSRPTTQQTNPDSNTRIGPAMSIETFRKKDRDEDQVDFVPPLELSLVFPGATTSAIETRPGSRSVGSEAAPAYEPGPIPNIEPTTNVSEPPNVPMANKPLAAAETVAGALEPRPFGAVSTEPALPKATVEASKVTRFWKQSKKGQAPAVPPTAQSSRELPQGGKSLTKSASVPLLRASDPDENEAAEAPEVPILRRRANDAGSEPSTSSSPYTPLTPDDPITFSPTKDFKPHPGSRHVSKRSLEEAPQWPLPSPTAPLAEFPPPVPAKSSRRSSVTSMNDLQQSGTTTPVREIDESRLHLDGPASSPPNQVVKPSGNRTPIRSFSRPLPISSSTTSSSQPKSPMGTISIVRNQQTYGHSTLRAPPALMPGRVITKDSDLATIPESDTASVRTLSVYLAPTNNPNYNDNTNNDNADRALRTTMDFSDTEPDDIDGDTEDDYEDDGEPQTSAGAAEHNRNARPRRPSLADSRSSSEMSDDWYKTPRERLGLGGFIRRNEGNGALWALEQPSAESPSPVVGEGGGGASGGAVSGNPGSGITKKPGLRGVFKRG